MSQPTANIVDALSGEEVCPLCFDRYSGADACTCVVCRAVSCPSCAELLDVDAHGSLRTQDTDGAVRCFACRPVPVTVSVAKPGAGPLSLPRPIFVSNAGREQAAALAAQSLPALPFPLTSSPHGVRQLRPRPLGSVFLGLPPVSAGLSQALSATPSVPAPSASRLGARAQRKLALLSGFVSLGGLLFARSKGLLLLAAAAGGSAREQYKERALAFRARLPGYRATLQRELGVLRQELRTLRGWIEVHARRLSASGSTHLRALMREGEPRLKLLTNKLLTKKLARSLSRPKSAVVDPSRPVHL
jgi:hypothetical protein